jgi:nucleoside-diphosphate-sugar epimerase
VDSLLYGQMSLLPYSGVPGFEFIRGDARDEELMQRALSDADAVVPLAAIVGAPACRSDPWLADEVNLGAIVLLERLRSKSQLLVYPNTNSGYGHTPDGQLSTEDTPLSPVSLYARTKCLAEDAVLQSGSAISLRMATIFGVSPRMRIDLLVNQFVFSACTARSIVVFDKDYRRNFLHVGDAADAFVYCLSQSPSLTGEVFNLGLDEANLTKGELALAVQSHVPGCHVGFADIGSDPDRRSYTVSSAKLRSRGYAASRSLDSGIAELVTGFSMWPRGDFQNA